MLRCVVVKRGGAARRESKPILDGRFEIVACLFIVGVCWYVAGQTSHVFGVCAELVCVFGRCGESLKVCVYRYGRD